MPLVPSEISLLFLISAAAFLILTTAFCLVQAAAVKAEKAAAKAPEQAAKQHRYDVLLEKQTKFGLKGEESKEFYRMNDAIRAAKRRSEAPPEHREARLKYQKAYDQANR